MVEKSEKFQRAKEHSNEKSKFKVLRLSSAIEEEKQKTKWARMVGSAVREGEE